MEIHFKEGNIAKKGVYGIVLNSKHHYIGRTDRCFITRWGEHINNINTLKCNRHFKNLVNEDSVVEFSIIRYCKNNKECKYWEAYYINKENPDLNVQKNIKI